jgi:carbonic anhydrase
MSIPCPKPRPMPCRASRRAAAAALLAIGLTVAGGAARASDHAAATKPAASAAEAPADIKDKKPKPDRAEPAAQAHGPQDPMDMLRERLAKKLGAKSTPEPSNPNVMRVTSKPSAPVAADHEMPMAPITPVAPIAPIRTVHRKAAAAEPLHAGAAAPATLAAHSAHWDYAGTGGPETWGQMKPEFAKCSSGSRQSPIDIRDGIKVDLDPVRFDYKASAFRVIDNGHTVQVNVGPGNSIEVMGRRYDLVQFHFHRPSEERVNGKQFDMVAHLVHKDIDGRLAVVAVLLDRGSAQPIIQSVWNNLPLEKGDEVAARGTLNLNELLPAERSYFTYMGSLTTPPCSEGVLWMVLKNPVPISAEQVGIFARLYPMNARPIQSASGRLIKESN